jgi:hypothetical protein
MSYIILYMQEKLRELEANLTQLHYKDINDSTDSCNIRRKDIQRSREEMPEASINFRAAYCFSEKTECTTMLSSYWKLDTLHYLNPKCNLLKETILK